MKENPIPPDKKILVFGATGHYGRYVVESLIDKQITTRIVSRNPAKAKKMFNDSAEIVEGDLMDTSSFSFALRDISGLVISISAGTVKTIKRFREIELDAVKKLLGLAKEHGVPRVVYISIFDPTHPLGKSLKLESAAIKTEVESMIAASGLNWTIFGAPPSADLFFAMLRGNRLIVPGGGPPRLPTISPVDVGELVAQAVIRDDLNGKRLRLVGPDVMSFPEAAERLGKVLGYEISVFSPPLTVFRFGKTILRILKPISKIAHFGHFMLGHILLLNRFPEDLANQAPADHRVLTELFDYAPTTFEREIRRRGLAKT